MVEQDASEPLAFELELPRQHSGEQSRCERQHGGGQVEVHGSGERHLLRARGQSVEGHGHDKQRNREVNERDVLSVFSEQRSSQIQSGW